MKIIGIVMIMATFTEHGKKSPTPQFPYKILETYDSIDGPRSRIAGMAFPSYAKAEEYVKEKLKLPEGQ